LRLEDNIPIMQIRDKSIVCYGEYIGHRSTSLKQFQSYNMSQQKSKAYAGLISAGAKKRLTRAITLLIESSEKKKIYNEVTGKSFLHQMSFITLTVSNNTKMLTGKEAHQMLLSHFLQWMRRTKKIHTYVWKAEIQKRGQIHYHITTPAFINYQQIKDKWNNLQRSAGLLKQWDKDHHDTDPNSTDIHSVRKINDLAAYMIKYFTKSYQNEKSIGGKVWDCSDNLKASGYFKTIMNWQHQEFLDKCVAQKACEVYNTDRFAIYKFKERPHSAILSRSEMKLYDRHIEKIRRDTQLTINSEVIELAPTKDYSKTTIVTTSQLYFKNFRDDTSNHYTNTKLN
jgi:hypothetical protein